MHKSQLLLVAVFAAYGAGLLLSPLLAVSVACCVWLLNWEAKTAPARLLALSLGLVTAWRAHTGSETFLAQRARWIEVHGTRSMCSGQGIVVSSPTVHRGSTVITVDTTQLDCDPGGVGKSARVRLSTSLRDAARGDLLDFAAELAPVTLQQNLGLLSPIPRAVQAGAVASGATSTAEVIRRSHRITAWIDRARAHVRERIVATYAPKAEALGRALVLGENDLEADDDRAFRQSGLSHLLAVSGTHLVFAIITWMTALRALLVRMTWLSARCNVQRWLAPLGAISAIFYADFAGGSGSAWRAAWMMSAVYLGQLAARRVNAVQALALSLGVGAAVDPWVGFDLSFLLSAAATFGLIVLNHRVTEWVRRVPTRPLRLVATAAGTTVCAMLPCVPVLSLMSPDITVAGVLANVIAGPLGEVASLPLCLVHAVMSPLAWVERGLAICASGALLLVGLIAKCTAAMQFARVNVPSVTGAEFCVLLVGAWALARVRGTRPRWAMGGCLGLCLVALEFAAQRAGAPQGQLRVTINDVGQGDSIFVDFPDGRCMLIDAGGSITGGSDPGVTVLQPLMRARRRKRVDVVVITHPHPDHYGGFAAFLPAVDVGEVWMQEGILPALRGDLAARHVPVRGLSELCDGSRAFGQASVYVLGPCPSGSTASNANNASIVLQIRMGQRSVLLPGDAEEESEAALIARHGDILRSDLLKVGHHGSRSSSSVSWLSAVQPRWAAISAGARNRFGHPVPAIEARLARFGATVLRTDQLGSIIWQTDGQAVTVRTARPMRDSSAEAGVLEN